MLFVAVEPVPAPWELVFGSNFFGRGLTKINIPLQSLAEYVGVSIFLTVAIAPHLDCILQATQKA